MDLLFDVMVGVTAGSLAALIAYCRGHATGYRQRQQESDHNRPQPPDGGNSAHRHALPSVEPVRAIPPVRLSPREQTNNIVQFDRSRHEPDMRRRLQLLASEIDRREG